ncbi:MAG: hypothetical protein RQ899_08120 [Pseudomonadales bacterium]|nr:hypothetical protein [Pseudomonadales bacterium]
MRISKKIIFGASLTLVLVGCASVDPGQVVRPSGTTPYSGNRQALVERGRALWTDASIGSSGLACQSCHVNGAQFKDTFKQAYPHQVAMSTNMAGLNEISAEQMVQFCMIVPMKSEPLPWESEELAALTAYTVDVAQKEFMAK